MSLKVFKACIDDDFASPLEVNYVALVDFPAIEKNFMAFKEGKRMHFDLNEAKRIISGPAMLADTPIYRNDQLGEYFVLFEKPTIFSIVQKFFKKGFAQNFNLMHDDKQQLPDITIFESFITDTDRGIQPMKGFEEAPDGSWFISAKVENDDAWEKIKAGEVKGFSVEGLFNQVPLAMREEKLTPEQVIEKMKELLKNF